jgi:hypothetical protein
LGSGIGAAKVYEVKESKVNCNNLIFIAVVIRREEYESK